MLKCLRHVRGNVKRADASCHFNKWYNSWDLQLSFGIQNKLSLKSELSEKSKFEQLFQKISNINQIRLANINPSDFKIQTIYNNRIDKQLKFFSKFCTLYVPNYYFTFAIDPVIRFLNVVRHPGRLKKRICSGPSNS